MPIADTLRSSQPVRELELELDLSNSKSKSATVFGQARGVLSRNQSTGIIPNFDPRSYGTFEKQHRSSGSEQIQIGQVKVTRLSCVIEPHTISMEEIFFAATREVVGTRILK